MRRSDRALALAILEQIEAADEKRRANERLRASGQEPSADDLREERELAEEAEGSVRRWLAAGGRPEDLGIEA